MSNVSAALFCSGLIAMEVYFLRGPGILMVFPTMSAVYVLSRYHLQYQALLASLLAAISTFLVVAYYLISDEIRLRGTNMRHGLESGIAAATIVLALTLAVSIGLNGKRQGIVIAFGIVFVTIAILPTVRPQ